MHLGQHRADGSEGAEEVRVEDTLRLLQGERFRQPDAADARVVDDGVDTPGTLDRGSNTLLDRPVLGHVHFDDMQVEGFPESEGPELLGASGVAASEVPHRREDDIALARQELRDPPAESGCSRP